jgi:hypothetical protein
LDDAGNLVVVALYIHRLLLETFRSLRFFFSFSLFDDMLNAPISYQVNKMTVLRGGNQIEGMTRDPK